MPILPPRPERSRSNARRRLLQSASLALVLAACAPTAPPPLSYDVAPPPLPTETAVAALEPGAGVRVLVDTSRGMRGFAAANERVFAELYARITAAASLSQIHPVELCPVGAASSGPPTCAPGDDGARIGGPRAFDARSATLSTLLLSESTIEAPSVVDDAEVVVAVSDGIESALDDGDVAALGDGVCVPGPDTFCLQHALIERIEEGYSVWLVAFTLPFEGEMYPERTLDDAMWSQLEARVADLQHIRTPSDSPVRARVDRRTPTAFRYFGPRPLLVAIAARDAARGQEFTETLVTSLRGDAFPYELPTGQIDVIRLTDHAPAQGRFIEGAEITRSESEHQGRVAREALAPSRLDARGVRAAFECVQAGRFAVRIRYAADPAGSAPEGVRFEDRLSTSIAQSRIPEHALLRGADDAWLQTEGLSLSLGLDCLRLDPGVHPIAFDLTHRREVRIVGDSAWWQTLSTETTWGSPQKLYRLSDIVEAALALEARAPAIVDRYTLLFGRPVSQ